MIFYHKTLEVNKEKISFKKKQKISDKFSFIPIQYEGKDFIVQTPVLYIPYGINKYSINDKKRYLDISFQNAENDININLFLKNLTCFYEKINSKKCVIENFIKESNYSQWMRLKINLDCLFYDQNKNIYKGELPKAYGSFIIHLSGLWLMDQKIWFEWTLLQARIHIPPRLKEFAFFDDDINNNINDNDIIKNKIPPPPPLPPPDKYSKMLRLGVSKEAVEQKKSFDRIRPEDLQSIVLKKGKNINKNKKKKKENFTPSLDEIRNALQSLQKIN